MLPRNMRVLALIAVAATCVSAGALNQRAACNRDNCYRAVIATRHGSAPGRSDCSSYQSANAITTTIPDSVITVTRTITLHEAPTAPASTTPASTAAVQPSSTATAAHTIAARMPQDGDGGNPPPDYASACDNDRYSSACSCLGFTARTTTKVLHYDYVTTTVTATPTAPNVPAGRHCPASYFALRAASGQYAGQLAQYSGQGAQYNYQYPVDFNPDPAVYSCFTILSDGTVTSDDAGPGVKWKYIMYGDESQISEDANYYDGVKVPLVCSIVTQADSSGAAQLVCSKDANGQDVSDRQFATCGDSGSELYFNVGPQDTCEETELLVVY